MRYLQAAGLLVVLVGFILLQWKLSKTKTLCDSCKFQVGRERTGTRAKSCNIFGCPAYFSECKAYWKKD